MGLTPTKCYEDLLGDALEELIARKLEKLVDFAEGLNELGVRGPAGERWNEQLLGDELARLGT
jgi:hypothetical protein